MAKRSRLADTLFETIGLEAAKVLINAYGGKQIKIPDGSRRGGTFSTWLDEHLGLDAANSLRSVFGGEAITVPMLYDQMLAARNRNIVADYGVISMLEMVRKYRLSQRQIRTILNSPLADEEFGECVKDDRQMGLF